MLKLDKFTEKHPYMTSIIITISLLFVLFISGMVSFIGNIGNEVTFLIGFLILSIILVLFINRKGRWTYYGFYPLTKVKKKKNFIFIPLFILGFIPLLVGVRSNLSFQDIIYLLIYMAIVAFVEETIFRGIILKIILKKGYLKAIIGSSFLFSLAHILNILQVNNLKMVIIQILYALIVGMILSALVIKTNNIIYPIVFHYINNMITSLNPTVINNFSLLVNYIMFAVAIIYLIYLLFSIKALLVRPQLNNV